jgi:hypothetical protein
MTKLAANEIRSTVSISIGCKILRTIYTYTSTPVSLSFWTEKFQPFLLRFVFEKDKICMHPIKVYGKVKA